MPMAVNLRLLRVLQKSGPHRWFYWCVTPLIQKLFHATNRTLKEKSKEGVSAKNLYTEFR